jgi:hypothetical protein
MEERPVNDPQWQPSHEQASEQPETRPTIRSIYVPKATPAGTPGNEGVVPAAGSVIEAIREAPRVDPRQGSTQGVLRYRSERPRSGGPGLYSGLAGRPAAEQAASLAGLLGGHPESGAEARLASLEECQTLAAGRDPRQVQTAYARAAAIAARCEVLAATQVQLVELEAAGAAAPRGALAVRSASTRTAADLASAKAELLSARWTLTQTAGQNLRSAWLYPSKSLPTPAWMVQKDETDPRAATPGRDPRALYRVALAQRAAAVVAADAARVSQIERWQTGKEPVEGALLATAVQQDATLEFVATLARMYEGN